MGEIIAILTTGMVVMSGFGYLAYKRWLDHELEKTRLRTRGGAGQPVQDLALMELKRQVETLQAIVTSSDYEARRRLQHQLEEGPDSLASRAADEPSRRLAERPEAQRHSH